MSYAGRHPSTADIAGRCDAHAPVSGKNRTPALAVARADKRNITVKHGNGQYPKSWAPWFRRKQTKAQSAASRMQAQIDADKIAAAILNNNRRVAWWRLVEECGWRGGVPMARAVPDDKRAAFRAHWDASGAVPHVTEGA